MMRRDDRRWNRTSDGGGIRRRLLRRCAIGIVGGALVGVAAAAPPEKTSKPSGTEAVRQGLGNLLQRLFTPAPPPPPKPKPPTAFVPDQRIERRLVQARQLIEERRVADAVALAQTILDEPEESFIGEENGRWLAARDAAEQLLIGTGPEGIAEYRRQFGDEAAFRLRQALDGNDLAAVGMVARRYFLTAAGFEAVNLLASVHLDAGRPGMALTYFDQLADSPVYARELSASLRAKRTLAQRLAERPLAKADPALPPTIVLGGTRWPLERLLDAVQMPTRGPIAPQRNWPVFQANPARRGRSSGGLPLLAYEWLQPSTGQPVVEGLLDAVAKHARRRQRPVVCEIAPVALDGVVYVRHFAGLRALDGATGRLLWNYTAGGTVDADVSSPAFEVILRTSTPPSLEFTYVGSGVHGHLSADERHIYVVDQLSLNPSLQPQQFFGTIEPSAPDRRGRNRLTALERRSGNPVWHFGDSVAGAAVYFLGPPLPADGRLFVMGETRSELRLFCLEPEGGGLLWTQPLAMSQRRIDADPFRANQSLDLACAGGVLVCPTNLLRVFGFDPLTQRLLWNYGFADESLAVQKRYDPVQTIPPPANPFATEAPIIHGNRVVIASALSPYLHCVDLYTGARKWRIDRRNEHYVGGVIDDRLVLVGRTHVRGVDLEDGRTVWQQPIEAPAGRGAAVDSVYLVPLADGRVLALAASDGTIHGAMQSRGQLELGNLLVHRNRLLSSGARGLAAFPLLVDVRREIDERLARDPADPRGRFLRGQMAVNEGRAADAVVELCAALEHTSEFRERDAVIALLFDIAGREALQDPAAAGPLLEKLRLHADSPQRQGIHLRLRAEHHLSANRLPDALEALQHHSQLKLTGEVTRADEPEMLTPRAWTRRFAHRLASAKRATDGSPTGGASEVFAARLENHLKVAEQDPSDEPLETLTGDWFGTPFGDRAGLAWAARLTRAGKTARAEALLFGLLHSPQPSTVARALAELATLYQKVGELADALFVLERLGRELPSVRLPDGTSGAERLEAFLADAARRQSARPPEPFANLNAVRVESVPKPQPPVRQFRIAPARRGLPFFDHWLVGFEYRAWKLLFVDLFGSRPGWEVQLPTPKSYSFNFARGLEFEHAGHLLFFPQGDSIVAVSALDRKMRWVRPSRFGTQRAAESMPASLVAQGGGQTVQLGPAGAGYLCLRTDTELFAVDPWTGDDLWGVRAPTAGLVVTSDERNVYLTDADGRYTVRRGSDGAVVHQGQLPGDIVRNRRRHVGGFVLVVDSRAAGKTIRLYNPLTGTNIWERKTAVTAREYWGQAGELALLDGSGKLLLLDQRTGAVLLEDDLAGALGGHYLALHVFSDRSRLFVAIEQRTPTTGIWYVPSSPNLVTLPVNGSLFCYERTSGRRLWRRTLEGCSIAVRPGSELPVLIGFSTRLVEQNGLKNQRVTHVEVLDKATGKTMGEATCNSYMAFTELATDPKERLTELRSWTMKVQVHYLTGDAR